MNKILLAIKSRNSVIELSNALNSWGVMHRIVSTPSAANLACGLSIMIDSNNYEKTISVATSMGVTISAILLVKKNGVKTEYVRL